MDIPKEGLLDIDKGIAIGRYGYVITHPNHGVLLYYPPTSFIRQISINSSLIHEIRKVRVPSEESLTSPQIEYSTQRITEGSNRTIGHKLVPQNVNERVDLAARQREKSSRCCTL